jgi:hypothetical protein
MCEGQYQCEHEDELNGCVGVGSWFVCMPCPKGSACYASNKAQDDRKQTWLDAHAPPLRPAEVLFLLAGLALSLACLCFMYGLGGSAESTKRSQDSLRNESPL